MSSVSSVVKPCLLVVDDEVEVCESVYHLLRRKYHVLKAHSAAEALELMREHDVQIIMTDQRMPNVTGVEMLKELKVRYPEAIRMLFTGYADLRSVIDAINQGHVYRYLSKPWQPEELEAAVADAAAEYSRLVDHAQSLGECQRRAAQLEEELSVTRRRMAVLEEEYRRLVDGGPDPG